MRLLHKLIALFHPPRPATERGYGPEVLWSGWVDLAEPPREPERKD